MTSVVSAVKEPFTPLLRRAAGSDHKKLEFDVLDQLHGYCDDDEDASCMVPMHPLFTHAADEHEVDYVDGDDADAIIVLLRRHRTKARACAAKAARGAGRVAASHFRTSIVGGEDLM